MPKIVSMINLKGGVAKTTTTIQLAECLCSQFGKRVLVIDLDPQTNATSALITEESWERLDEEGKTLYQLFLDKLEGTSEFDFAEAVQSGVSNLELDELSLLASSIRMIDVQDRLTEIPGKNHFMMNPMEVLRQAVHGNLASYHYVLIDCPPNLGFITQNGLEISDYYLIPTVPDALSTYGIPQIVKRIHKHASPRGLKIRCLGLVVTKFASGSPAHVRVRENLPARFLEPFEELGLAPAPVFDAVMPQANGTAEAMDLSGRAPRTFKDKYGYGAVGGQPLHRYVTALAQEFLRRVEA